MKRRPLFTTLTLDIAQTIRNAFNDMMLDHKINQKLAQGRALEAEKKAAQKAALHHNRIAN